MKYVYFLLDGKKIVSPIFTNKDDMESVHRGFNGLYPLVNFVKAKVEADHLDTTMNKMGLIIDLLKAKPKKHKTGFQSSKERSASLAVKRNIHARNRKPIHKWEYKWGYQVWNLAKGMSGMTDYVKGDGWDEIKKRVPENIPAAMAAVRIKEVLREFQERLPRRENIFYKAGKSVKKYLDSF